MEIQETATNWSGMCFDASKDGRLLRSRVPQWKYDVEVEFATVVSESKLGLAPFW